MTSVERCGYGVWLTWLGLAALAATEPSGAPPPGPTRAASAPRPPRSDPAASEAGRAFAQGAPLDLNRANETDLRLLPGIGPALARRIVEWRDQTGGLARPEDLLQVRGIGPNILARIRPHIAVGEPAPGSEIQEHRNAGRQGEMQGP